jgi:phytoene desaturase (3,4-didehydrolycopene-forming)
MGPSGQDTIIAIVPLGHIDETKGQNWEELRSKARESVLRRMAQIGIHDFEDSIKVEHCVTPLDWRGRFNLVKGATHGLSHTIPQMACFRPNNRHQDYRNLYFAGASTHPGTGIPNALISARLVSERIVEDLA